MSMELIISFEITYKVILIIVCYVFVLDENETYFDFCKCIVNNLATKTFFI